MGAWWKGAYVGWLPLWEHCWRWVQHRRAYHLLAGYFAVCINSGFLIYIGIVKCLEFQRCMATPTFYCLHLWKLWMPHVFLSFCVAVGALDDIDASIMHRNSGEHGTFPGLDLLYIGTCHMKARTCFQSRISSRSWQINL